MRYSSDDRTLRIVGHLEYNFVQAMQSSYHAVRCLFISYPRGPASGRDIRYNPFFGLYHNALFDQDSELIPSYQIQAHIPKPPIYQYHCLNVSDQQFHQ